MAITLNEIMNTAGTANEAIEALKEKSVSVPTWAGKDNLEGQYDPNLHPVITDTSYRDITRDDGVEKVTRITYDLQRLATKRTVELICGTPVKRVYKPENDKQKEIAKVIESIYQKNRIDAVNVERCNMLFAGCEVVTLWYAVEQPTTAYGIDSALKFKCRNFSPMLGDSLWPLFDEYGDLVAMSFGYKRKVADQDVECFETYSSDRHIKWSNETGEMRVVVDETFTLGKIPCIYVYRPTPIWENTSPLVYEIEWAMSRNGNYLRKNSRPLFVVFADEQIPAGNEKSENSAFKSVMQYPKGSTAQYVTWDQAVENLKFFVNELRQSFFTQLQLPDFSFESMKATPMSGEARKQLFIDAQLKVKDEAGRLLEFFDRELNVVKAFVKAIMPDNYVQDIDALSVETEITPFAINDERDTISNLLTANGGKPIISQRESIQYLGWSSDVDATMAEIAEENKADVFDLTE